MAAETCGDEEEEADTYVHVHGRTHRHTLKTFQQLPNLLPHPSASSYKVFLFEKLNK